MDIVRKLTAGAAALALSVGGLVIPAIVAPSIAQAADNGDWSIFPKTEGGRGVSPREFFFYDVSPGQEIRDTVVVTNRTDQPLPLTMYASDAENTAQGGGLALKLRDQEMTDVGAWITPDDREIVVPAARTNKKGRLVPGEREVDFTVQVPRNASPGDHVGGVVSIDLRPQVDPNRPGAQLAIQRANGVRVYARVAGPLSPQLGVTDVSFVGLDPATLPFVGDQGGTDVRFTVANTGNVRINPEATLEITGLFGRSLHKTDVVVPEILPGETVELVQRVEGMPALDQVTARIELTSDQFEGVSAGDGSAWSVSWIFVGVLAVLLIAFIAYAVIRRRRPRAVDASGSPEPVDNSQASA